MGILKERLKNYRLFQPDYEKANRRKIRVWNREQKRVGEGSARYKELEEIKARFYKHLDNVEIEREHLRQHVLREMQKEQEQKRAEEKAKARAEKIKAEPKRNITVSGPFRSYTPPKGNDIREDDNANKRPVVKVKLKKKPIVVKIKNPNLKEEY